jgi:hypothetical protein
MNFNPPRIWFLVVLKTEQDCQEWLIGISKSNGAINCIQCYVSCTDNTL